MASTGAWRGVPADRVVAIVASLETGKVQIGTGYLTGQNTVLTALHCLNDRETLRPAARLEVVRRRDAARARAQLSASALDIAVLTISYDSTWESGSTVLHPVAFGRVDATHSGELTDCEALGYPLWQYDPVAEHRAAAELHGTVRATEGAETGVLVLRDPLLTNVGRTGSNDVGGDSANSPWGGLSGALVFYRGTALGVIVAHYPRQGNAALTIVPLARIADLAALGDPGAAEIAAAIGLPAAQHLAEVRQGRDQRRAGALSPPRFHGVPRRNPLFTGREAELAELRGRFDRMPHQALVPHAAVGLGGVGKTEMAVEYCYLFRDRYTYIWWVSAATRPVLVEQVSSFAPSLGIPTAGISPELLMTYVREWLEAEADSWLLVLDNADDPSVLRGALPEQGSGHVLLTSRFVDWAPLGVEGLPVEPLPVNDAAKLLVRRSGREASPEASVLGERLGGLPLAIFQAGAFIKHSGWSFERYTLSLNSRAQSLLADNSAELYRPTGESLTTISVWDRSFEAAVQRSATAAQVMEILACYEAEAIPRWLLAGPVIGADEIAVEKALTALTQLSLITYADQLVSLHRLVQEAIRSRTMVLGGTQALTRSLDTASQLLDSAFPQDPDDTDLWPVCAELIGHCVRITEVAAEARWSGLPLASAAIRAAQYLNARGSRQDALSLLDRVSDGLSSQDPNTLQARILSTRARVERNLGRGADAERDARAAVELTSAASTADARSEALEILGRIQLDNGDRAAAKATLQAGLDAARSVVGGSRHEVIALNYLARAHTFDGELDIARAMLTEALDLDGSLHRSEHADTAWTLDNLGLVELAARDFDAAEDYFRRALAIEASVHGPEHPRSGWSLRNLARTLVSKGDVAAAIPYYELSLQVIEHATPGNQKEISATLQGLAEAETLRGDHVAAERYMRRAGSLRLSGPVLPEAGKPVIIQECGPRSSITRWLPSSCRSCVPGRLITCNSDQPCIPFHCSWYMKPSGTWKRLLMTW